MADVNVNKVVDWKSFSLFLLLSLSLSFSYYAFFSPISVDVVLDANPQRDEASLRQGLCLYPDVMQLFYAHEGDGYTERQSEHLKIETGRNVYTFSIGQYKTVDELKRGWKLRFDPVMYPGTVSVRRIVLRQDGCKPLTIDGKSNIDLIQPVNDVEKIESRGSSLVIVSSGCDPQLELRIPASAVRIDYLLFFKVFCVTLLISVLLYFVFLRNRVVSEFNFAPYLLIFVLGLIFSTAAISRNVIHADEVVHVRAGEYYQNHVLPPEICDPETRNTYSVFGVSRLDNFEIVYTLAGKFSRLLEFLNVGEFQRFRFFNVFLFFALFCLSLRYEEFITVSLPLLISPQIWYLFTYFNSDAFSLFVIMLVCYQVIAENSMTNRYLNAQDNGQSPVFRALLVGLLFSLLLLLKLNYYIFIVFLCLVFLHKLVTGKFLNPKTVMRRMGVILLISAAIFGVRWGVDVNRNGLHRGEKRMECRAELAEHDFNPNTPLEHRYPFLRLRQRDVPVGKLFEDYNWGFKTFVHSFGVYYSHPLAAMGFYKFVMAATVVFGLYVTGAILFSAGKDHILLLGIVIFCSCFLVALDLWNSWTASFQAQGRYLFPIPVLVAYLIHETRSCLNRKVISGFVLLLFCLSTYSYIFIGMRQLLSL